MEKRLGKITSVEFGFGGYQDCQFGLSLSFESESSGCGTIVCGGWGYGRIDPDKGAKWTEADRTKTMAVMAKEIAGILNDARVEYVSQLKNKPVELTFENNTLKDWRILKEVL